MEILMIKIKLFLFYNILIISNIIKINNIFTNDNQISKESNFNVKLDSELLEVKPDSPKYYKKNNQKTKKKYK